MALFDYVGGVSDWADDVVGGIGPAVLSVTAGNLLVFIGKWETGGPTDAVTMSLNDGGRGLVWSTPVYANTGAASAEDGRVAIAWAKVGTTGSASVTATLSAARGYREYQLHEFEMGAGYTSSQIAAPVGNSDVAVASWSAASITAVIGDFIALAVATAAGNFVASASAPLSLQANAQGRSKLMAGIATVAGSTVLSGSITDDNHVYAAAGIQIRVSAVAAPVLTGALVESNVTAGGFDISGTADQDCTVSLVVVNYGDPAPDGAAFDASTETTAATADVEFTVNHVGA